MDLDEVVRTITREVLKQLQSKDTQDCIMVLAENDELSTNTLRDCLGDDTTLCYFGEDISNVSICRYILPRLSCSDMADLASGRASGPYMREVLNLLLQGTEIETLDFEYRHYSETAPGPLYTLYEAHLKTLSGFGLKPFQPKRPDSIRLWQKLVTEKTVSEAQQQGASIVQVPVAAQITPLAAETAKNLNMTIQKSL